jgi:hypothetical protein
VKRLLLEDRLLNEIRHQLFRPDAIAYALERANQLLQARARESRRSLEDRHRHLRRVLGQDTELARKAIAKILDEIMLRPTPKGLVVQLRGNLEGLLTLGEQAPLGFSGSGGWI